MYVFFASLEYKNTTEHVNIIESLELMSSIISKLEIAEFHGTMLEANKHLILKQIKAETDFEKENIKKQQNLLNDLLTTAVQVWSISDLQDLLSMPDFFEFRYFLDRMLRQTKNRQGEEVCILY